MADVLTQLQRASWREIEFPIMGTRDFGFQHQQTEHRFIFKDEELVESLGRKNPTFRYRIPFRQGLQKNPWINAFTQLYPQFLAACLDRSRGTLVDPIHGGQPAKCVSLSETLDVGQRDGVSVEVEFIRAPAEDQSGTELGGGIRNVESARSAAGALDRQIRKIPFNQAEPPKPTISPLDAVSAVAGQLETGVNRVSAAFADAAFRVDKASTSIDRLKNPGAQPVLQQAARLRAALLDLEERVDPTGTRPLRRLTTTVDYSISALAGKLGMKIQDLVRLNPALARSPLVRAGTDLRVFADVTKPSNGRAA